jgi:hypothetical protein
MERAVNKLAMHIASAQCSDTANGKLQWRKVENVPATCLSRNMFLFHTVALGLTNDMEVVHVCM